ncbi:hypothetical protein GCM10010124_30100 [Pilimelia terevasa]|uniref:Uncharacterized protein n=1 Tax=Pilimelia terevasa TaxID=53372 RepID=A0A8J3BNZ2_9ACTN|nr:hypothetical protein [Pilimelia terevasa]GGK35376.1 hypothetical protein GCM10010124_30100 [Pilimelia terevasa]
MTLPWLLLVGLAPTYSAVRAAAAWVRHLVSRGDSGPRPAGAAAEPADWWTRTWHAAATGDGAWQAQAPTLALLALAVLAVAVALPHHRSARTWFTRPAPAARATPPDHPPPGERAGVPPAAGDRRASAG